MLTKNDIGKKVFLNGRMIGYLDTLIFDEEEVDIDTGDAWWRMPNSDDLTAKEGENK